MFGSILSDPRNLRVVGKNLNLKRFNKIYSCEICLPGPKNKLKDMGTILNINIISEA